MSIPHVAPPEYPDPLPPAGLASRIRRDSPADCRAALLGTPDDLGVRLNSGRPGAALGPRAFRAALARYGTGTPAWDWPAIYDAGDVIPAEGDDLDALDETHRRVSEAADALLALGLVPIGIGGGHDLSLPFIRPVARRFAPLSVLYLDAHLDVRDTPGSGMPFRRLVEDCGVVALHNLGHDPLAAAREHLAWFRAHGGHLHAPTEDPALVMPPGDVAVSLDLDVIDAAFAPGVSAPSPRGWTPDAIAAWCELAGRNPRVRCLDVMELSPPHDEPPIDRAPWGRTARLAAHCVLAFLRGLAAR